MKVKNLRSPDLRIILLACGAVAFQLVACGNTNTEKRHEKKMTNRFKDESFEDFRTIFFADIDFQRSRIKFPLPGNSTDYVFDERFETDTKNDTFTIDKGRFFWNKKGWIKLNKFDRNNLDFVISESVSEDNVIQIIKGVRDDFVVRLEFKKINGKFYLVYYSSEWN